MTTPKSSKSLKWSNIFEISHLILIGNAAMRNTLQALQLKFHLVHLVFGSTLLPRTADLMKKFG